MTNMEDLTDNPEQLEIARNKRRRRAKLLVILGCFLFVFLFYKGGSYVESQNFCVMCHGRAKLVSWEQSSHSSVSCFSCHFGSEKKLTITPAPVTEKRYWTITLGSQDINVSPYMNKLKLYAVKISKLIDDTQVQWAHTGRISKDYVQIVTMLIGRNKATDLSWKYCSECHANVVSKKSKTDSTGHSSHLAAGLTCEGCHGDVAHEDSIKLKREDCARCHGKSLPKPRSHNTSDFYLNHGKMYLKRTNCLLCHPKGSKEQFCMDCHGIEMPHRKNYPSIHTEQIKNYGIRKCQECHRDNSGKKVGKPSAAQQKLQQFVCAKCHGKNLIHSPAKAIGEHPQKAIQNGTGACLTCHKSNECASCHGVPMPHPKGFIAQHGPTAIKVTTAKCNVCHLNPIGKAPVCGNCHGGLQMPHDKEFINNHGKNDLKQCAKCHSPQNPAKPNSPEASPNFCKKCHSIKNVNDHYGDHWDRWRANGPSCYKCHVLETGCIGCH